MSDNIQKQQTDGEGSVWLSPHGLLYMAKTIHPDGSVEMVCMEPCPKPRRRLRTRLYGRQWENIPEDVANKMLERMSSGKRGDGE